MPYTSTQNRPSTSAPGDGSRTMTLTGAPPQEDDEIPLNPDGTPVVGALRLRGTRRTQRVAWDEDVIDNEGCGKKKSKICCIYHKPRRFDESSDEESSDSDSDSCDHVGHDHGHPHRSTPNGGDSAAQARPSPGSAQLHQLDLDTEPNAYEAPPGGKKGKKRAGISRSPYAA
ncbi:phosphatase inhibitor-domain-containing protein [Crucibulum laeve]|uniref:Type 1 phosphatases regulator n=1 Tax=Crucibulum laeve TaxID=68775 RepID=A0A5C3LW35_9AGAR|nr:phosphatase inhibitor-domain-containing protein [Crucibulum laeve]